MEPNKSLKSIAAWGDSNFQDKSLDKHAEYFISSMPTAEKPFFKEKEIPELKSNFSKEDRLAFEKICGKGNLSLHPEDRIRASYGKFYLDLLDLKKGKVKEVVDAVVYPRSEKEVEKLIKHCKKSALSILPVGAASSVTRALRPEKGGIAIDLTRHMNKIHQVSVVNSTVTLQPGILGPEVEKELAKIEPGYTVGHFPQSFEFSTVGGWVAARGAGQASAGYGRIDDMVLGLKVATDEGILDIPTWPCDAEGIDMASLFIGSEGAFGIITEVTLGMHKKPKSPVYQSYLFRDFETAITMMREVMQGGYGNPHFFRLSDPEETETAFAMKGKSGGWIDRILSMVGYAPQKRCLLYSATEGDKEYSKFIGKKISKLAQKYKALSLGSYATLKWLEQRYSSAYLRDFLMEAGVRIDTLETSVTWENLTTVWEETRKFAKSHPNLSLLTHISHPYRNGANLYFVFISPMEKNEEKAFTTFHKEMINVIIKNGGSISHHHGIGKLGVPWFSKERIRMKILNSIKTAVDENKIFNPGVLGLK